MTLEFGVYLHGTPAEMIGWQHDGGGVYPLQTMWSKDVAAFERACAADPGHVIPVVARPVPDKVLGAGNWR